MNSPQPSPALGPTRGKAPEPSAALLALQDKGLELPTHRSTPISVSPQSNPAYDSSLRVSPLSIVSTPSNFRPSPAPPPVLEATQHVWRKRISSVDSVETTISGIINLYTNLSKHSFRSEYEDVTADQDSDSGSTDNGPPMPMVHQPKAQAYRDTIAPLLEYQFCNSNLEVPGLLTPFPSPMSLACMPMLMHPDASPSVPSLRLSPDGSRPDTRADAPSPARSIQLTPEMPPPPEPSSKSSNEAGNKSAQHVQEGKVNLEVPDVRDAESWYDEPLSPISPEDLDNRNIIRESQQSAVSPQTPNGQRAHFRALAFESLSPPSVNLRTSPGLRSANVVEAGNDMVPPPLDLSRSHSAISRSAAAVNEGKDVNDRSWLDEESDTQSGSQGMTYAATNQFNEKTDRDLEAMSSTLSLSYDRISGQTGRARLSGQLRPEEIDRPRSAFSDSSDSFIIYDTFSGQVKALLRDTFGKKKEKKSMTRRSAGKQKDGDKFKIAEKEETRASGTRMTKNVATAFSDDVESYKYPYGLKQNTESSTLIKNDIQPAHRMTTPDSINGLGPDQQCQARPSTAPDRTRRSSEFFAQLPNFAILDARKPSEQPHTIVERSECRIHKSSTDQEIIGHPAIPLTGYQKYGVEVWYESNKKKRKAERERLRKETEKAALKARKEQEREQGQPQRSGQIGSTLHLSGPGPGPESNSKPGSYRHAQAQVHGQGQTSLIHELSGDSSKNTSSRGPGSVIDNKRHSKTTPIQKRGTGSTTASGGTIRPQTASTYTAYNNDLFEASGGGKKKSGGLAKRLLMSSEEKRKRKVKESITIVGGGRMGGQDQEGKGKGLVSI